MVSVLTSNAVDSGLKKKEYKIGIFCFSVMQAALRRKSKDWLAGNQDDVFAWGDMSLHKTVVSVS